MKKNLLLLCIFLVQFFYSQIDRSPIEAPFYAEKISENNYKIFKISMSDQIPLIYELKNGSLTLTKKYSDVSLFEIEYSYLEKITSSKDKRLVTAFLKDGILYEAYSQKRSIEDYNEQTIEIYSFVNSQRKLVKSFPNMMEFSKDEFFNYFFTF